MNTRVLTIVLLLVAAAGCSPNAKMDADEAAFRARPRNYDHTNIQADVDKPEHWSFSNTPTITETNEQQILKTVNRSLAAIGLPVVTNSGVRLGRISETKGGWIYYHWLDYPLGELRVTFVQEYGMVDGEFRLHTVWKPSHAQRANWQAPHL